MAGVAGRVGFAFVAACAWAECTSAKLPLSTEKGGLNGICRTEERTTEDSVAPDVSGSRDGSRRGGGCRRQARTSWPPSLSASPSAVGVVVVVVVPVISAPCPSPQLRLPKVKPPSSPRARW